MTVQKYHVQLCVPYMKRWDHVGSYDTGDKIRNLIFEASGKNRLWAGQNWLDAWAEVYIAAQEVLNELG